MKSTFSNRKNSAMTFFELLVVIVCLLIAVVMLLPIFVRAKRRASRINCISNLKQVNVAFRIWEGDNNNEYPMAVSVTNGGAMELIDTGNVAGLLRVAASNEMSTTKIFVCPDDAARTFATNFDDLNGSHISYFFSADASNEENPNLILDGDDDLTIGGKPIKSGLLELSSNAPVSWSGTRHAYGGNLGFADGSVDEEDTNGLEEAFWGTGLATNRIAIP